MQCVRMGLRFISSHLAFFVFDSCFQQFLEVMKINFQLINLSSKTILSLGLFFFSILDFSVLNPEMGELKKMSKRMNGTPTGATSQEASSAGIPTQRPAGLVLPHVLGVGL